MLFRSINAFTCSVEEQGRGTLHAHFLIWNSDLNKKREELYDEETFAQAERFIQQEIDRVASTKGFFNDVGANEVRPNRRRKFIHDCKCQTYGMFKFPKKEELLELRCYDTSNAKVVCCPHCMKEGTDEGKFSFTDLQNIYLKTRDNMENFTSVENETITKRLKSMAIDYQKKFKL